MSLRKKLTVLLLVVSLAPLLLLGVFGMQSMRSLGMRLAEQSHQEKLEREYVLLTQTLHDTAGQFQVHLRLAEHSVEEQAVSVEQALASDPSVKVRWTADFKRGRVKAVKTPVYANHAVEGAPVPFSVSFEAPVIHLAPGVNWTESWSVQRDAGRLASLGPWYRKVRASDPSTLLWHRTVLKSGLHSVFPGSDQKYANQDERRDGWYRAALESKGTYWTRPWLEPLTGQIVLTAARRVRHPNGKIAGVTAIDVAVPQLLERRGASAGVGTVAPETLFLRPEEGEAHAVARSLGGDATVAVRPDDPKPTLFQVLETATRAGEVGRYQGRYAGRDSIWVFQYLPEAQSFLAVNAPVEDLAAQLAAAQSATRYGTLWQLLWLFLFLLLAGVAVAGLAYPIARRVTGRLEMLSGTAQALAVGELNARADAGTNDEIGALAVSLNRLAVRMGKTSAEEHHGAEDDGQQDPDLVEEAGSASGL